MTALTEQEYQEFTEYIATLGLTPSEAIRLLIVEELARVNQQTPMDTNRYIAATKESFIDTYGHQSISSSTGETPTDTSRIPADTWSKPKPRPKRASGGGSARLTTTQWEIEGKLPCPHCKQWGASVNFARDHIHMHGLPFKDKAEFLHHPDYKPIVEQMYKERIENTDK